LQLNKIKLHSCTTFASAQSQITLDDDYNVPDYRPDIVKVLKEKGELHFDEAKAAAGAAWLKGRLVFRVLYRSDQENGKISCLKGEIPFQEKLNMDGVQEYDVIQASGEIEDLTIGVIHSRKISVRAVILLKTEEPREKEDELCVGIEADDGCEKRYRNTNILQLLCMKRDQCRQKSEITLPSSKPNVQEILWKSLEIRNLDTKMGQDGVKLSGEVLISVLYQEEEETDRVQWYEMVIPLDCGVECDAGTEADIIYKVKARPASMELEVKPDYDGEERVLVLELVMNLDIRVWKEQEISMLEDVYSLKKEIIPVCTGVTLHHISVKNDSQCRLTEQMELAESQEKILQICSCEGTVHLESTELTEQGVRAEGILVTELLYITTDDQMPLGSAREIYPFEQLIEIPQQTARTERNKPEELEALERKNKLQTELDCRISQLSAVMLDQDHVEIKAVIGLDLLAFEQEQIDNITDTREEPLDMEQLQKRPGLVGYIAKDGDSLWSIAKENHTTVEDILRDNHRTDEDLRRGEKILIVKKVELNSYES
jgi:LysM repeat protein